MRDIAITRDEAERLVDLLVKTGDRDQWGSLVLDLMTRFGMRPTKSDPVWEFVKLDVRAEARSASRPTLLLTVAEAEKHFGPRKAIPECLASATLRLLTAASLLRWQIEERAPFLTRTTDWERLEDAMRIVEGTLKRK